MEQSSPSTRPLKVFLSHASEDRLLVARIVDLVRAALNLSSEDIRCTSLDGHRLSGGAFTDVQLRREVIGATTFVAVISKASLQSMYVLFELGARWGARKPLIPLFGPDIEVADLKPPLQHINGLRCDSRPQLFQFIADLASHLDVNVDRPAAYSRQIDSVLALTLAPIRIVEPKDGQRVGRRVRVEGTISDLTSKVTVVVHPVHHDGFWVQPVVAVEQSGRWRTDVYIGRTGTEDVGAPFEIRGFVNPLTRLVEGDILTSWPQAQYASNAISVWRE